MRRLITPVLLLLSASALPAAAERPPNVVIIFTDDQGYADVGTFGAQGYTTPNLDGLARDGTKFKNFHVAQAVCSASRAALLTGCYPNRLGIHGALNPLANHGLNDRETTIAEMLRSRGYATGMAGKWHLGHREPFLPPRHGFDESFGLPYSNDMYPREQRQNYPALPLIENGRVIDPEITLDKMRNLTTWYTERAVSFIERNKARPFFFYLAHSMPHVPLAVSDKFKGKSQQGLYGDVIMEIDWSVGEVLRALAKHGLERNTLVIFTSDNGPWLNFGNHAGSAGPLREGKGTSWEGGTRVPCLMRWPGHVPAGASNDNYLMTIDLLPTIAHIAGASLPPLPIDGLDVWPLLARQPGAKNPHDGYGIWYSTNQLQAVVSGDGHWKLLLPHTYRTLAGKPAGRDGKSTPYASRTVEGPELYDLRNDLGETTDLAAKHPDQVKRLLAFAEKCREELGDSLTKRQGRGTREPGVVAAVDGQRATPGVATGTVSDPNLQRTVQIAPTGRPAQNAEKAGSEPGVVVGYVSNVATTQYLEGARVEAPDGQTVFTDREGQFQITLPAGATTLTVSYTGLARQTIPVEVSAGARVIQNVQLTSELYTMEKFTVSGLREGSALAITRQQQAPNVQNIVASDQFGNIADGNVGELLQQLPGVSGEYNGQDIRSVQIRGIDAALNSVSMDGSQLAASDSSGLGRVFEFEQASLGMIEMIELTKAPTPDMAANSIGGHVNLVTKSAFDRAVRRSFSYSVGGVYRTRYLLRSSPWWREPFRNFGPSMNFTYADRIGSKENVGVLFTATYHSQPGGDVAALYNYQNTAADPAPITSVTAPRPAGSGRTRLALGGKVDYKLSQRTILTLNTSYNWFYETPDTRSLAFATTAAAANFRPGYTMEYQEILPNNNANATMTLGSQDNTGRTVVLAPSVRFRTSLWDIDYGVSYSNALKRRGFPDDNPKTRAGNLPGSVVLSVRGGLGWIIDRTGDLAWPKVTQTAGRDIYDLNNYTSGVQVTLADNGLEDTVLVGRVNARRKFALTIPFSLKAGLNLQQQDRRAWNHNRRSTHLGPDRRANTGDEGLGAFLDTSGKYGDTNQGNRMPPWPDPFAVTRYLVDTPENWLDDVAFRTNQRLGNDRKITEKIYAGYIMGNFQFGRLAILPGVRVERTETDAEGPLATGTPPVFTGRKRNEGQYQNAFPGIHLKYTPTRNLVARASYSTSIGRPSFGSIIPDDTVDDVNQVISVSNPSLKPQFSDNFDVSLEYYFEPVGLLSATLFRKEITGFQFADSSQVVGAGPNNGFGGNYEGYRIRTTANGGRARYEGFELSYRQQFTFLPGFWRGFGVNLNYTRLETEGDYGGASATSQLAGFVPETGNAGINYVYHKFDLRLNAVWRSEILVTSSANPVTLVYEQPRLQVNLKTKYNFSRRLGLFFQIDNLNNAPITDRYRGFESRPLQTRVATPKIIAGMEGRF